MSPPLPRAGVEVHIGFAGFLLGDVGVNLGGGGAGVAQQFLDHPQVGVALQHVAGEGMPQGVGVDALPQSGSSRVVPHQLFDAAPGEAVAVAVEEHGGGIAGQQLGAGLLEVTL